MKFENGRFHTVYRLKSLWRRAYRWLERSPIDFPSATYITVTGPLQFHPDSFRFLSNLSKSLKSVSLLILTSAFTSLLGRKRVSFVAIYLIYCFVSLYKATEHVSTFSGGRFRFKIGNFEPLNSSSFLIRLRSHAMF